MRGYFQPTFVVASGSITSGEIGDGAVLSGNIGSGQVGGVHISDGTIVTADIASGQVQSGQIASGTILGASASGARNIASGTIGRFDIGNAAIVSGGVASGAIGQMHLSSGAVNSGHIGNAAVVSGGVASGQIGHSLLASGAVLSGHIGNAAVVSGGLGSGSVGQMHLSSGLVNSGHIGNVAVVSGSVASGQLFKSHFTSGTTIDSAEWIVEDTYTAEEYISGSPIACAVTPGIISGAGFTLRQAMASVSGRMPAVGVVTANYASGAAVTMYRNGRLFSASLSFSGWIARNIYVGRSGQLSASGAPTSSGDIQQVVGAVSNLSGMIVQIGEALEEAVAASGDIGSGSITGQAGGGYFDIASGTLSTYDHGSGTVVRGAQFITPIQSGTGWTMITEEVISGIRAVQISQSGVLRVAMASVSGRMPAIGVVFDNVLSGIQANVYTHGVFLATSGLLLFGSGLGERSVWIGRSGELACVSGSWSSGGWASGDFGQKVGVPVASGTILLSLNTTTWSGGPIGGTALPVY